MKCRIVKKISRFLGLVVLGTLISPIVWGQEWLQNIKNPQMPMSFQFSGFSLSSSDAKRYSDKIEMESVSAKAIIPISKDMSFRQSLSFDFNQTQIDQINKDTTSPVPEKLTAEKFGYQFIAQKNETEYYGLNTQIGSSSDSPFFNWSVTDVSLTSFYYVEKNPRSAWVYLLNYSNQRSFLPHVPLPGFIYIYNNQKGFSLLAGIPVFGFTYFPTSKWMINYFTVLPWIHQFKITYFFTREIQIYSEYKISPELYKLVDHVQNEDRIILEDQKIILGSKFPVTETLSLDLYGGSSFNRKIYQAKRPGSREDWREEIANQSFFNIQLMVKF